MEKNLITRYAIREVMGLAVLGLALFWPAGRIDWWPAWTVLGIMTVWVIATVIIILRVHPALFAERLGPRKGAKTWDTILMSLLALMQLTRSILAGLDQRYGWTGGFPFFVQMAAFVICVMGYALFIWATASNAFFSQIVRIQSERGHTVATQGPYHYLRHPAYFGATLYELAVSILLASWWAFLASGICIALLVLRTALEDHTLRAELPGYADYARQVRYRLLPGIW